MSDFESIDENALSLFDGWIHENYGAPESTLGEVILCRDDDTFADFREWVLGSRRPIAWDTETSGLYQYVPGFEVKLIQWGDTDTSYVFVWGDPWFQRSIDFILNETDYQLVAHNATYDALVLHSSGCVESPRAILERCHDTRILSHLADPRGSREGGTGHGLKALGAAYVDDTAPDSDEALKNVFKSQGWKLKDGWSKIPSTHPTLVQYAGLDTILTARLYPKLVDLVKMRQMSKLVPYEHKLQVLCADMEARGMRVDVDYASHLYKDFARRQEEWTNQCIEMGVTNPDAPHQVAGAMIQLGELLVEKTDSGAPKVDKMVLQDIINREGPGSLLAEAVVGAKNAGKWRESYVGNTLRLLDGDNRIHPKINALAARTARMSVQDPPVQQLPSGLSEIRHMFLAEPGCVMSSIDFSGVELRVLAALANDPVMKKAFAEGADLHQITADAANVKRKVAKMVNFAKVYGGGAKGIARQAGIPIDVSQRVVKAFDETYSGVTSYSRRLSGPIESGARSYVETYSGRRLPVDSDRPYAALNYVIQSTARDVLGKAMVNIDRAGLWEYMVLPVHDEMLCSFPRKDAHELARQVGVLMEVEMEGVYISTEPDVGQESWGSLYEGSGEDGDTEFHEVLSITDEDRAKYRID
jgi:DNA polymerase-1